MLIAFRLLTHARRHAGGVAAVVAAISSGVAVDLLKPWPMKLVVDCVIGSRPLPDAAGFLSRLPGAGERLSLLAWMTVATIALFLTRWLIRLAQTSLETHVGNAMAYSLGNAVFDSLQRLSIRFHHRHATGDLVKRIIHDAGCIRDLSMGVVAPLLTSVATLVSMFVVIWRMDHLLAAAAIAVAPILAASIRIFSGPMERRTYTQYEAQGKIMALSEQTLSALPIVRAFGREEHEDLRFGSLCRESDRAYLGALASQLRFKLVVDGILALGTASLMALGGYHVAAGRLSVGDLLVFLAYLASLYTPLQTLAYLSQTFVSASAGARRVFEVMDSGDRVTERSDARRLPPGTRCRGHVRLEDVEFEYDAGRPVLNNINLDVPPGATLALVGATGAGKSTLVSLIPRFFDPQRGRVLLDGVDVRDLCIDDLRSQISLVLQEPFLLPTSVAENIAFGRPGARREEIVAAAVAANADAFIRELPRGYDTVIGDRGATLSGGERQRISIARALLKNAPILILDEPTSALDAGTEALIVGALERLIESRTTLIIAHRLSTVRRADRIAVLERGTVVESGSHEELVALGGSYARLCRMQTGEAPEQVMEIEE